MILLELVVVHDGMIVSRDARGFSFVVLEPLRTYIVVVFFAVSAPAKHRDWRTVKCGEPASNSEEDDSKI